MATIVYLLCALTSLACTMLLYRSWRRSRARLLLWSWLCFLGLSMNNLLLVVDVALLPEHDLTLLRTIPAAIGVLVLVFGLVQDA